MNVRESFVSVQYLRAVAALLVVLHHARSPKPWLFNPLEQFNGGTTGVDIFFVISGFIMFTAARGEQVGTFVWRRLVRVAPLYWIATLLMLALAVRGGEALTADRLATLWKSFLFIPHFSLDFPDQVYPYYIPGWTLNYEMFFYALFAVGIAVGRPLVTTTCIIGGLVILGLATQPQSAPGLTYTNLLLLEFLAGVWIGYVHSRRRFQSLALGVLLPLGFIAILSVGENVILRGLAASAILVGALSLERSMPKLDLLKALGDASYAIYLFHVPAMLAVSAVIKRLPLPQGWLQFGVMIAATMVASMLVGLIVRRFVERPMLQNLRTPPVFWPASKRVSD
ncbi:MAG: acyltransferase 3 family protein [Ramlibacter sp.]|nr:acyltransferase 3 family protein [Ramlibacter sp.]